MSTPTKSWEIRATLLGHKSTVQSIVFSPDAKRLFTGSVDGQIKAWQVEPTREVVTVDAHGAEQPLRALAVSPDGELLASASMGASGEVKLWNSQTLQLQKTLSYRGPVYCLAFSPDSARIAAAGEHEVYVWNARSGERHQALDVDTIPIFGLAFSPDGQVLYTSGHPHVGESFARTGVVRAWNAQTGDRLGEVELPHPAFDIDLGADGTVLAVAATALRFFDVARSDEKVSFLERFSALDKQMRLGIEYFQEQFYQPAVASGRAIVAGAAGSPGPNASDAGHVALFSYEGRRLAELQTGRQPHAVAKPGQYTIRTVAFSPDERVLAAGGNEGVVTLWMSTRSDSAVGAARIPDRSSVSGKPPHTNREDRLSTLHPLAEDASPAVSQLWDVHRTYRLTREQLRRAVAQNNEKDSAAERQRVIGNATAEQARCVETLLRIARDYPRDEAAFDSLALGLYICRTPSNDRLRALRLETLNQLGTTHFHDPELSRVFYMLERAPSAAAESFLKKALEQHPEASVRAHACYSLAQYHRNMSEGIRLYQQTASLRERAERIFGSEAAESFQNAEPEQHELKAARLYGQAVEKYSEIPKRPDTYSRLKESERERMQEESLGDLARNRLSSLRRLAVGAKAPEIRGEDIDGAPLRLSDYRGKVVALVFSATWCGPCRQMYEYERTLVEQMGDEAFALLHVNSDFDRDQVKRLRENGEITWRCWWDGPGAEGPIATQWNIEARPDVYVLDQNGVIRYRGVRNEQLALAVRQLLTEAKRE